MQTFIEMLVILKQTRCMNKEEARREGKDDDLNETKGSFWFEKRVNLTYLGWRRGFKVKFFFFFLIAFV